MKAFILLILFFAYTLAQVSPICSQAAECNTYQTFSAKKCDTTRTPAACADLSTIEYKTTSPDNVMCKSSLNFGGFLVVCGGYSTIGCKIEDVFSACAGSFKNPVTNICEKIVVNGTYAGEGERCNSGSGDKIFCRNNLQCIQQVCRKKLTLGDNCYQDQLECGEGLTCDSDLCVIKNSKLPQDPCKSNDACASGSCTSGRCRETRSKPCYFNADCTSGVCDVPTTGKIGKCFSSLTKIASIYQKCIYDKCSSTSLESVTSCTECDKIYVDQVCETQCAKREDARLVSDGYLYDCTARTRIKQPDNTCGYRSPITNCKSSPDSGAFTQGMSMVVALIALVMIFA